MIVNFGFISILPVSYLRHWYVIIAISSKCQLRKGKSNLLDLKFNQQTSDTKTHPFNTTNSTVFSTRCCQLYFRQHWLACVLDVYQLE